MTPVATPAALPVVRTRWEVVPPFRVLSVEPTIAEWGLASDDFTSGRRVWLDHIHPDDFDAELRRLARDVDDARAHPVSYTTYRFRLGDGTWHRLASINVFEFDDAGRAAIASTLLSPDARAVAAVLAMRADEQQRRDDSDRLAAILRCASDPIVLTDAGGRTTWCNDAFARTGLPRDLLNGPTDDSTLDRHPENREALAALRRALSAGRPSRGDLRIDADGTRRWLEVDGVPVRGVAGTLGGFMLTLRDVSASRIAAAERELRVRDLQRLEAVGRLAAGVAHDFGNLLQVISGSLELLDAGLAADHPLRRHSRAARGAAHRAADLTRQLLQFGKPSRTVPQLLDARRAISELEPMLHRLLRDDLLLHVTLPPYPLFVRVEPAEYEQVLRDLVVNARHAIEGPGDIWVSLTRVVLTDRPAEERQVAPGSYAELLVRDSGAGMLPEVMARAFEPFFNATGAEGTGLGLASVFGIARHGGGYAVGTSDAWAGHGLRGTTFRVGLPEAVSIRDDDDAPPVLPPARASRVAGHVLVVEDDAAVAQYLVEALSSAGMSVTHAVDAATARAYLLDDTTVIDVLVSDVVMPGESGPELVQAARRIRPALPVLFVSGYVDDALARHREVFRDAPLLRKPFTSAALVTAVQELLSRRP